jgi:sodium transport system ATP-binding protein
MIIAEGLRKRFGQIVAVDGVSLQAEDGRITGLLGPNGAGKTTTLRLLYGLMKPDAGTVRIDEVDVVADPLAAQAQVGVLPDAHGLYPRLSAREHIRYFGELQGLRGSALEQRVGALIDRLEMRSFADRRTAGFSQGERMKVSLARALVHGPNNVILDEPTNGLDVMSTRAMRRLIRELRDEGKCVLFSSHVMQEVSALCDVIVIVARGRVVARGTPDELREQSGHDNLEDAFVTLTGDRDDLSSRSGDRAEGAVA